jgi:hypothetical protein
LRRLISEKYLKKKKKIVDDDITQVKSIMDDSSNPRNTQKLWLTGEADEK